MQQQKTSALFKVKGTPGQNVSYFKSGANADKLAIFKYLKLNKFS